MQEAIDHLHQDPILKPIVGSFERRAPTLEPDAYFILLKSIVSQQLSIKAAATIWGRFLDLFPDHYPAAHTLLEIPLEAIRGKGLSFQKAGYLQNIARFHLEQGVNNETLRTMSDAEIIQYLTQIKGVGKWTVEMLLIFSLARPDVFPVDDLGVRNAMIRLYGVTQKGKALHAALERIAAPWSPFRSFACIALWEWKG